MELAPEAMPHVTTAASTDALDAATQPYLGRWNKLVSTTNWEKGRIICEWRRALVEAHAPANDYSDEAWGRRVGNVTGQHVGRLRRTFDRFGAAYETYAGLYWSHFQTALDWQDAEMWLEGAVQNGWSVSDMRAQRWEAIGAPAELKPSDQDVIVAEVDDDYTPVDDSQAAREAGSAARERAENSDRFDPDRSQADAHERGVPFDVDSTVSSAAPQPPARPFADLAELPSDLAQAFDAFKLAILHHKMAGWQEVSRDDVIASLDALEQLALADAE